APDEPQLQRFYPTTRLRHPRSRRRVRSVGGIRRTRRRTARPGRADLHPTPAAEAGAQATPPSSRPRGTAATTDASTQERWRGTSRACRPCWRTPLGMCWPCSFCHCCGSSWARASRRTPVWMRARPCAMPANSSASGPRSFRPEWLFITPTGSGLSTPPTIRGGTAAPSSSAMPCWYCPSWTSWSIHHRAGPSNPGAWQRTVIGRIPPEARDALREAGASFGVPRQDLIIEYVPVHADERNVLADAPMLVAHAEARRRAGINLVTLALHALRANGVIDRVRL